MSQFFAGLSIADMAASWLARVALATHLKAAESSRSRQAPPGKNPLPSVLALPGGTPSKGEVPDGTFGDHNAQYGGYLQLRFVKDS